MSILELNDDTTWILGRPNFWCLPVAELLRQNGSIIERSSEHEQAAVIHWLLNMYIEHGDNWREVASGVLRKLERRNPLSAAQSAEGE